MRLLTAFLLIFPLVVSAEFTATEAAEASRSKTVAGPHGDLSAAKMALKRFARYQANTPLNPYAAEFRRMNEQVTRRLCLLGDDSNCMGPR